jgi:CelD/BcsL family acetyltransferase involved in cellulose biosynthesis
LRLVLLRQIPEDDDLRRQWNGLLERSGDPQVFYTYEWALAVQRAYAGSLSPLVLLGYDSHGDLCGVAALAKSGHQVSFLCATTGDYCDCLSAPEDRPAFIAAVLSELRKENVRNVILTNLPADSATVRALRDQARRNGYCYFQRLAYVCAQFSLQSLDRANHEEPQVARAKMIRRSLKAMATEGPMRLDHMRCWNDVATELPRFMRAHVARFLVTGRISNTARAKRRVFLAELAKLLSDRGWLCLTRLMTGTKAVAWNYGFQFQGSWFWYQPTFDSELEKHSPGRCLLVKIIHEAVANADFKMVDLGLGAEEYKDRVANRRRETLYVTLRSSAPEHALEMARYSVAKLATASPRLEQGARATRSAFNQLKKQVQASGAWGTANWTVRRACASVFGRDEVFFYELINSPMARPSELSLSPIDLDLLAAAAMQYSDDEETLVYLLRGAKHLRQKDCSGFALLNAEGQSVHFTWVAPFARFHWAELNSTLPAPSPDSVLLFDSWTPASRRGRGYYGLTLGLVAAGLRQQGRQTWVFSASTNISSLRGLEKCGVLRRFSVVRQKVLWWQWLSRRNAESANQRRRAGCAVSF